MFIRSTNHLCIGLASLLVASSGCSTEDAPVDSGVVRDAGHTRAPADSGSTTEHDAGTTDPTPDPVDAAVEDTGTTPDPTPMPSVVAIMGTVTTRTLSGTSPVVGARLDALPSVSGTSIANGTTSASGGYALTIPSETEAFDGIIRVTAAGYLDMYQFPSAPISGDVRGLDLNLVDQSSFGLLANFAGAAQAPGAGFIGIIVNDASGHPLAGVTVSSSPAGTVRYMSGGIPSSSATSTGTDGVAFIFSVPAGAVTVRATAPGVSLRAHDVGSIADAMTAIVMRP